MAYDWKNVKDLAKPIQATASDVVLSGHGYLPDNYPPPTIVPPGIELWILCPPGASIADDTGQALESGSKITKLGIHNPGDNVLVNNTPIPYKEGERAPDYVLSPPRGIVIKPGIAHLLGVEKDTPLSELWIRVAHFVKKGEVIRCFWAACTAIDGAKNPVVLYK